MSFANNDGTVGAPVFTNFSLSDGGSSGQTEADVNSAFVLLPNTEYFFSVTAPSTTAWQYTTNQGYNSSLGVTLPTNDVAYKIVGGTTTYFSLANGPQLIYVEANAVPEPSSLCLLAVVGIGACLYVRRSRRAQPV